MLLLSGGMDSLAIWRLLGLPPAVSFIMATRCQQREQAALGWASKSWGGEFTMRAFPMGEFEQENGYLPFRNPLLILAAAQLDSNVILGQIAEYAPDKNFRFYRQLERAVNMSGQLAEFDGKLRIEAPFALMAKGRLLGRYAERFGQPEAAKLLDNTWSCYRDGMAHCGECGGCKQRWAAEMLWREDWNVTVEGTRYMVQPTPGHTPASDYVRWLWSGGFKAAIQIKQRLEQNAAARRAASR